MISFVIPEYLLLLALLPPALFVRYGWKRGGAQVPFSFSIWEKDQFDTLFIVQRLLLSTAELALWLGIASLIIALAGPQFVEREKVYLHRGVDIMFVLDQSPSMAVRDFGDDTRFDAAKEAIHHFVSGRKHDPVGLASFGDDAALLTPPTLDYESFYRRLEAFDLMELGKGSALGLGIAVASAHLEKSSANRKVIVVIGDGEHNAGEIAPRSAAGLAASLGIKIYAIGIGSDAGGRLEIRDPESGTLYSAEYRQAVNMDLLRALADIGGGRAFLAGNRSALQQVFRELDAMEAVERKASTEIRSEAMHRQMILFGLLLLSYYGFVRRLILREVLS